MSSKNHALTATRSGFAVVIAAAASAAMAVPYPSQVRNTTGSTWEFVLNQDADDVVVARDGGNELALGALTAGRYTFDLAGFSTFDITVENSLPSGLARVSDTTNIYTEFNRPAGLAINRDPSSEFFGTVYVANSIASTSAGNLGRVTGDGIYALRPDLQGVDFSTPAWPVPGANDTTQARVGTGWSIFADGTNAPFRIALDDGGNIIAGDWSDVNGGIKYIGPDLTGGGLVLNFQNGQRYGGGAISPTAPAGESPFIHSAVRGVPNVTGTLGVDLVVSAMDQSLNRDGAGLLNGTFPNNTLPDTDSDGFPTDGNHVWRWNVGSDIASNVVPELVIDTGSQGANPGFELGVDSTGRPQILSLNIGVRADAEFFPQIGDDGLWIVTQPRFDGNESSIVIVDVDDTGVAAPEILWSSRQWTIDNDLDGYVGTDPGATLPDDPNNDVFRNTGSVDVSEDGSTLYVHRWVTDDENFIADDGSPNPDVNPYLGRDSNLPGALLAIPLDSAGLPVIDIDENGTPGDTSDDFFTNLESIETTDQDVEFDTGLNFPGLQENHEVEVDAAGNIYITDDISNLVEVFTPGGDSLTRYSFDGSVGSFSFVDGSGPLNPGDFNGDGSVDNGDLNLLLNNWGITDPAVDPLWVNNLNGTVDNEELNALLNNWGFGIASVPEPTSLLLLAVAAAATRARRR
ncbi:MAG: PEP-CTERM sorting domain-containing protein [Planctomycetota bacterium]